MNRRKTHKAGRPGRRGARGAFMLLLVPWLWCAPWTAPAAGGNGGAASGTVFFFCPEVSVNNHAALKDAFDTYLSAYGGYDFQPLSHLGQCEIADPGQRENLFLLSSAQYRELPDKDRLEPILVGVKDGETRYRRGLYVHEDVPRIEDLRGAVIATAGSSENSERWLLEILGEENAELIRSFNFLKVPKHVDALLAVSFGMARAAVAAEGVAQRLAEINPNQMRVMRPMAFGKTSLLPVVVAPKGTPIDVESFINVLREMSREASGRRCLKMLGMDDLEALTPAQEEELVQ